MKRTLNLKREVLAELPVVDLRRVAAGDQQSDFSCGSCLTWVSCYLTDCIGPRLTLNGCIVIDPPSGIGC